MHELALCGAIAHAVRNHAEGRQVETIRLRIGELRQVVPDTLEFCWGVITDTTPLSGSVLEIERVAARLRCDACAAEHELGGELDLTCPACGATTTTVTAGEEFLITSMDVAPARP